MLKPFLLRNVLWRLLEITHEGTNQVKESKINLLVHKYELFLMKENETTIEMITRFTDIVNGLETFGKTCKESEKVMKILRSLPSKWHTKVTTIQEAKDLTKLPIRSIWQRSYKRVKTKRRRA